VDLQTRLDEVCHIAVKLERETGVPPEELVAQWAVESQWGAHPAGQHNYFGIKRDTRHTKFCLVTTREVFTRAQLDHWNQRHPSRPARVVAQLPDGRFNVALDDEFADYDSLADSCRDYAWLISHGAPYHAAWERYQGDRDLKSLIAAVAHVYATSPSYADLVTTIAGQSNVVHAIAKARREDSDAATA
jgi:flagellum-specific peptidoglycan hydrolase FlgJ